MSTAPKLDEYDSLRAALAAARGRIRRDRYHRYEILDGATWRRVPGVTTVIGALEKPALVPWAARIQQEADIETAWRLYSGPLSMERPDKESFAERFRELAGKEKEHQKALREAGELGTDLHALIETWCKRRMGEKVADQEIKHERAYYVYAGFETWAASVDLDPIAIEAPVYSVAHSYAGTLDLLALVSGRLTLLDWKTSPRVYPEMRLQNIAYRKALEEMTGAVAEGLLVRLPKTGTDDNLAIEPTPIDDNVDELFCVFTSLLPVHLWVKTQR